MILRSSGRSAGVNRKWLGASRRIWRLTESSLSYRLKNSADLLVNIGYPLVGASGVKEEKNSRTNELSSPPLSVKAAPLYNVLPFNTATPRTRRLLFVSSSVYR